VQNMNTLMTNDQQELTKDLNNLKTKHARLQVLLHYGSKCTCCGEFRYDLLCIDHVNNDGYKQRLKGWSMVKVIQDGYPKDLQILCHNCNSSKHRNKGQCVHQIENLGPIGP